MSRTEDTVIVIQCANRKRPEAGHMEEAGRKVLFVADPASAPPGDPVLYRRPDDPAPSGRSWRDMLEDYNRNRRADNPLGLLPAWKLYENAAYGALAGRFGTDNLFILSAGWGLVAGGFLLPKYDITFSSSAKGEDAYKRRRRGDRGYRDFAAITERDIAARRVSRWQGLRPALPPPDGWRRAAHDGVLTSPFPDLRRSVLRCRTGSRRIGRWRTSPAARLCGAPFMGSAPPMARISARRAWPSNPPVWGAPSMGGWRG